MADAKFTDLTALTGVNVDETADLLAIEDLSATTTKKILIQQFAMCIETEGADVASASAPDIWGVGQTKHVTGTTTITSFAAAPRAGMWRKLIFDGAVLITHGANLNLRSAQNYVTQAGDLVLVYADTTTQFDLFVIPNGTTISSTITSGSAISLTTGAAKTITSIDLTAGRWNVFHDASFEPAATTNLTTIISSLSATDNTLDLTPGNISVQRFGASGLVPAAGLTLQTKVTRLSIAASATYYMVCRADFTVSTCSAFGKLWAEPRP